MRRNPVVCSGRFGGHRTHALVTASVLAAGLAAAWRSRSPPAREPSSDANEPEGTYRIKVTDAGFETAQQLGPDLPARTRHPQQRREDGPGADRERLDRRRGGTELHPAVRNSRPAARAGPARPAGLGACRALPQFAGSAEPGGAETSNPKTFDFGPLKPGATANVGLEGERRQGGNFTLLYAIDAGLSGNAKAETAGGAAPGGSFSVDISPAERRTPKSTVAGKSSKRNRRGRQGDPDRARCAEIARHRSLALSPWWRCPPAAATGEHRSHRLGEAAAASA